MSEPMTPEERAESAVYHRGVGMPSGATPEQIKYALDWANHDRPSQVKAVAAAIREAVADRWQPIDTAPKDGTQILVFTKHGEIEQSKWCLPHSFTYEPVSDGLYRKVPPDPEDGFWNSNTPTHWMPLPAPPA